MNELPWKRRARLDKTAEAEADRQMVTSLPRRLTETVVLSLCIARIVEE